MNRPKPNHVSWSVLGLSVIVLVAALVLATGVTWARYRTDTVNKLQFQPRDPAIVYLGTMVDGSFVEGPGVMEYTAAEQQMHFVLSNAPTAASAPADTLRAAVRVVASAGLWNGEGEPPVSLLVQRPIVTPAVTPTPTPTPDPTATPEATPTPTTPPETEEEGDAPLQEGTPTPQPTQTPTTNPELLPATVVRVQPGSTLYDSFGDGWVITFEDESGRELLFDLPGGRLSTMQMTLIVENTVLPADCQLQLQVTGEWLTE